MTEPQDWRFGQHEALWADPHPVTPEGQRLWRLFSEGKVGTSASGIRDFGQRICQIEGEAAAIVRTPETLDVERLARVLNDGRYTRSMDSARGWAADILARLAATPSPTPPEGLRAYSQAEHNELCHDPSCVAHRAASPAPDPGAGLREALTEILAAWGRVPAGVWTAMDEATWVRFYNAMAAARSLLAPSAEPPETT